MPPTSVRLGAVLFALTIFAISWWHWWTFQYRSFDLAFYVQSLWLALRGEWNVSLLDVPLMGNHAEPIVFLLTPLFALIPHPMLLVAVQTLALATMPFTAWRIVRRMGIEGFAAQALALLTVLVPATGFIGAHEFHPEAFSAPLLLLLAEAKLAGRYGRFWIWFIALLACKENIAVLLAGWCVVHAWCDRKQSLRWQWLWNGAPLAVAMVWIAFFVLWLAPELNGGRVDYLQLYGHLGSTPREILVRFFTEPQLAAGALWRALTGGNLVWGLLLSFAGLPLLRPRWLLIATPVFLQHLLSNRSSEWTVYFHYAAPMLPLLWVATAEAVNRFRIRTALAAVPVAICVVLQAWNGPVRFVDAALAQMEPLLWQREWKARAIAPVVADSGQIVTAGLPYLSHLATRRELYSLHFVLKGFETLSIRRYVPRYAPDVVLIDYADDATFNRAAAYYHPEAPAQAGVVLPSSDQLLREFLSAREWRTDSVNSMAVFRAGKAEPVDIAADQALPVAPHTNLRGLRFSPEEKGRTLRISLKWEVLAPRDRIAWLKLFFRNTDAAAGPHETSYLIPLGMCAPQLNQGAALEERLVHLPPMIPPGRYEVSAMFVNEIEALWNPKSSQKLWHSMPIGEMRVE